MKKILAALLLLPIANIGVCQKIHFTDTTNKWVTKGYDSVYNRSVTNYYTMSCCDTVTFYHVYSDLHCESYYESVLSAGGDYIIREDTLENIIYILDTWDMNEKILYNYNLQAGDTFHLSMVLDSTMVDSIISVDSVLINGYYYKKFTVMELDTTYPKHYYDYGWNKVFTYIEGIGNLFSPSNEYLFYIPNTEFLRCFTHNDTAITVDIPYFYPIYGDTVHFVNECATVGEPRTDKEADNLNVYPNPAGKVINITASIGAEVTITNLLGQTLIKTTMHKSIEQIDIVGLVNGVYMVCVTDTATGVKTVQTVQTVLKE